MKKIDLKKKAGVVACAAVMSMTMAVPCAFAAVTGNNGTTDVTVQTDPASTQCAWEAPTVIPFAADAAGNLTGPSADAVKIVNKSVFPIHVTNVTAAEQSPFKLVADVTAGADQNAIQFNLKNGATDIAAATGMNTAALENFDMGYAGAAPCTALASEDGNTGSADVTVYRIPSGDGQKTETVDVGTGGFWDSLARTGDGAALPALVALAASASALALAAGSKEHEEE